MQIVAIIIVFISASWEYVSEIYGEKKTDPHQNVIQVPDTEDRVEMTETEGSFDNGKTQKIWFVFESIEFYSFHTSSLKN